MSPVARNYKEGSVIYFAEDEAKEIYILKSGRVSLSSISPETGEEVKAEIKQGEFFGIKSVLGRYRREETAQVLHPSICLVFSPEEFEKLISRNFDVLLKLLRVFSNQLRRIGKSVRQILEDNESKIPATELFNIGEYYFSRGQRDQAMYAYEKYMEYYPNGDYYDQAKNKIARAEAGDLAPSYSSAPSYASSPASSTGSKPDMDVLGADDGPRGPMLDEEEAAIPDDDYDSPLSGLESLGQEMDDQWDQPKKKAPASQSPETPDDGAIPDDFGVAEDTASQAPEVPLAPGGPKIKGIEIATNFYEGLSLFSQENYQGSLEIFDQILSQKNIKGEGDLKFVEKAHFEKGRCQFRLDNFADAIMTFTNLIKKFPRSASIKEALFLIGQSYENQNNIQKAMNFFQKVVGMPPREAINTKAKKKLEELRKKL